MQLITEEYRQLNEKLHTDNRDYGTCGSNYLKDIMRLASHMDTQDLLDYGCGKSTLAHNIPFNIKQYDPAVPKYKDLPGPADVVVCTDVLEHIEPELIDNVLRHIQSLTKKAAYLAPNTNKAKKTLADGRNSHILLRSPKWWMVTIDKYFDIITYVNQDGSLVFIASPKKEVNNGKEEVEKTEVKDGQVNARPEAESSTNEGRVRESESSGESPRRSEQPSQPAAPKHSDFFVGI